MRLAMMIAVLTMAAAPCLARADDTHSPMPMSKAATPADQAFMASMKTMQKNMAVKPTGETDRDFVLMMLPHHQGAIDMAKVELRYGKDPLLRKLAGDIVKAQEQEIGTMRDWLASHTR
jgi:uncharacterized protein (DUF305 family)